MHIENEQTVESCRKHKLCSRSQVSKQTFVSKKKLLTLESAYDTAVFCINNFSLPWISMGCTLVFQNELFQMNTQV